MHELALSRALLQMAVQECQRHGVSAKTVVIEVGGLTSYKPQPIKHYFRMLRKGYGMPHARLKVNFVRGRVFCNACSAKSYLADHIMLLCPKCNSTDVEVLQGKELNIKEIVSDQNV